MIDREKRFYPGELAFDRKRTDPTDDVLVITDADVGTLEDVSDGETYRAVKYNDTNQQLKPGPNEPLADTTPLIETAYITDEGDKPAVVGTKKYTFPEFRLETVESREGRALDGDQPHQVALARFYAELTTALREKGTTVESPKDLKVLAMQANVDGKVILRGDDEMGDVPPMS